MNNIKYKNNLLDFLNQYKINKRINSVNTKQKFNNRLLQSECYNPDLEDCENLYNTVIKSRRLCILEFGSGWSTLVLAKALYDLKKKYFNTVKKLRKQDIFCLYFVETSEKWRKNTIARIPNFIKKEIKIVSIVSKVVMSKYKGRICTEFKKLPNCNPDFIYIDGPHIKDIKGSISNINFAKNNDFTPMISDLLMIENIFIPGTMIYLDGRLNNFLFLKNNFQRNWVSKYFKNKDISIFKLNDFSLGIHNNKILKFYKNGK